ncbi:MerR family transcriptional regulator [Bacillus marasmi]|uniref:MerR family transcriptional regulator n=1 Tax=Bacillus marasmi TaxID=1926279 RepID=UPI00164E42BE|nr:MerR family transcriptional regulator [Bacillus marasmi]
MFTVQEVANISHTTVKTLHHYHKIGLLIPEKTTEAGYRLYGRKDLERLQHILFYKELDFPLKEIKQLLDGKVDLGQTLISQKQLFLQKITRLNQLVETIDLSIDSAKEGVELEMEKMFKGFETEKEWQQALQEQNEYLINEYEVDLFKQPLDVQAMNEAAMEAQAFNQEMIHFLKEGHPVNDTKVLNRIEKHLSFLEKMGHPSTPQDFLNQTEFFLSDGFHRNMLEQQQTGFAYFLNKAAAFYVSNH